MTLREDVFIERYKPEECEDGGYYLQRDPRDSEEDRAAVDKAAAERRLWTCVEDDNGDPAIAFGAHKVNFMYYIITRFPCWPADEDTVFSDYDDESGD